MVYLWIWEFLVSFLFPFFKFLLSRPPGECSTVIGVSPQNAFKAAGGIKTLIFIITDSSEGLLYLTYSGKHSCQDFIWLKKYTFTICTKYPISPNTDISDCLTLYHLSEGYSVLQSPQDIQEFLSMLKNVKQFFESNSWIYILLDKYKSRIYIRLIIIIDILHTQIETSPD